MCNNCLLNIQISKSPVFMFLFQLFDLIYREETLLNVIKSVTRNGRSILLTAVLAIILVYLFSIVGFLFLRDDFIMEVDRLASADEGIGLHQQRWKVMSIYIVELRCLWCLAGTDASIDSCSADGVDCIEETGLVAPAEGKCKNKKHTLTKNKIQGKYLFNPNLTKVEIKGNRITDLTICWIFWHCRRREHREGLWDSSDVHSDCAESRPEERRWCGGCSAQTIEKCMTTHIPMQTHRHTSMYKSWLDVLLPYRRPCSLLGWSMTCSSTSLWSSSSSTWSSVWLSTLSLTSVVRNRRRKRSWRPPVSSAVRLQWTDSDIVIVYVCVYASVWGLNLTFKTKNNLIETICDFCLNRSWEGQVW